MEVQPQCLQMPNTPKDHIAHTGHRSKSNSYDTTISGASKGISDEEQDKLRMKQDHIDVRVASPIASAKSPHSIGQKSIQMPKVLL
ncbi:Aste57867_14687 [Aphanomyces stellatus]|uniref:Aste57867_14687 protein n=1 Tax=Aphanomyces stellatus TaxID=120398 RepID=A0A485L3Y7_9STRA|nr:hypothetical protein As57867_014632 [Aphanomyces stellatus]VFT91505.1 Aste57867_14687 [Aphanomyces stellatus]